ncbi:hypothetical protein [Flavisolibacter tropicus]|uniref:Uncharacterized protein n=1 Tax=Flavisolibacter tropicus TaxID=1492898 RepID=A0A172TYX9_9BACT|nr:hypothetical protein [Flavisolibacter tropicus]ANE52295.1 hypothetical protein SY85_19200 [Flavisolibacter tropicus]
MKQIALVLSVFIFSAFQQDNTVKVLGFFSNERSADGEHSSGYTLRLWQYNGSLIGILSYNQGLIGDQVVNVISNITYNKTNGDISFGCSLDGQAVTFKGKILPTKVTGSFTWSNRVDKNQSLKSCCKDAEIYKNYKSYKDWEKMMRQLY